jgi:hypothetical protein
MLSFVKLQNLKKLFFSGENFHQYICDKPQVVVNGISCKGYQHICTLIPYHFIYLHLSRILPTACRRCALYQNCLISRNKYAAALAIQTQPQFLMPKYTFASSSQPKSFRMLLILMLSRIMDYSGFMSLGMTFFLDLSRSTMKQKHKL